MLQKQQAGHTSLLLRYCGRATHCVGDVVQGLHGGLRGRLLHRAPHQLVAPTISAGQQPASLSCWSPLQQRSLPWSAACG